MSMLISDLKSAAAKGTITTDIIISDLPDDVIAALDAIAERVAMTREDFIGAVLWREARKPLLTEAEHEEWREGCERLARLREDFAAECSSC
jgi:hypothetical protein